MQALPAAPVPPPRRQLLVGTALAGGAGLMLIGAMSALWWLLRDRLIAETDAWVPSGVSIPEIPSNVMLISFAGVGVFAQWAVYASKRGDRQHTALAVGTTALMAAAIINAQVYTYTQMELSLADAGVYGSMFYAITGTMLALIAVGLVFSIATVLRVLGRAGTNHEIVAAHALFWYLIAAAFAVVWFVVYVKK